jgi:hypothetical protein
MKFRKKPLEIEAEHFTEKTKDRVLNWISGNCALGFEDGVPILKFMTVHGDIAIARIGDWIVKDARPGTYYPVKPDVFERTYDAVKGTTR